MAFAIERTTFVTSINPENSMKKLLLVSIVALIAVSTSAQTKSKVYNCSAYGAADGSIDLIVSGGRQPYTFKWSNGATSEDLTNLRSGRYTVTITDASPRGCTLEISFDVAQPLGTAHLDNSQPAKPEPGADLRGVYTSRFDVFPNPTENTTKVVFYNSDNAGFTLRVLSPTGAEVYSEKVDNQKGEYTHQLDFTNLAKGIYFVEIKSQKESITKQLVVQ
jgi:hypothetical protein